MPKTREVYLLTGNTVEDIKRQLNAYLRSISDRVDKLEGIRGELETASGTFTDDVTAQEAGIAVTDDTDTEIHSLR